MRFDTTLFSQELYLGTCTPPNRVRPFQSISRTVYAKLLEQENGTLRKHFNYLKQRTSPKLFSEILAATSITLRATASHFPAYRFHVAELINDEWIALVDWHKPFHRDHMSHQVMCYYIARKLLDAPIDQLSFDGTSLREICLNHILNSPACFYLRQYADEMGAIPLSDDHKSFAPWLWSQMLDEAVFLACYFHDIGYPWQFLNNIAAQLNVNGPLHTLAFRGVSEIFEAYKKRLVFYPFNGYSPFNSQQPVEWTDTSKRLISAAFSQTHGMPGALSFLYLNDLLRDYPVGPAENACNRFCIDWAAMAIVMHDMAGVYRGNSALGTPPNNSHLRVKLSRDPLSFLMTLVDQIQDFGRSNADFSRKDNDDVSVSYGAACSAVDLILTEDDNCLRINYEYAGLVDYINNTNKFKPKAQDEFFDSDYGYIDYSELPISRVLLTTSYSPLRL